MRHRDGALDIIRWTAEALHGEYRRQVEQLPDRLRLCPGWCRRLGAGLEDPAEDVPDLVLPDGPGQDEDRALRPAMQLGQIVGRGSDSGQRHLRPAPLDRADERDAIGRGGQAHSAEDERD